MEAAAQRIIELASIYLLGETMPRIIDLSEQRFGGLVALHMDREDQSKNKRWICRCDCGATISIRGDTLRRGFKVSCGCAEFGAERKEPNASLFFVWQNMVRRCHDKKSNGYENYGGRGISVCARWLAFEDFCADVGERPEGATLDRYPDTNGNYEPGNVRWATWPEQQNNRTNNRRIEIDGITKTLAEWCQEYGQAYPRVLARIDKYGWDAKTALVTPRLPDGKTREWLGLGERE